MVNELKAQAEALEWGAPDRYQAGASDEQIALAAKVDPRHFGLLYERYADRLYRYAISRTGSAAVADDIVSETAVSALESLERFDPEKGSFSAWIFTIASRRIADHSRVHQRLWRYITRQGPEEIPTNPPLDGIVRDERRVRVRKAIERLPDNQRETVLLRYVAELPIAAIAETLSISEGAVKMRLQRGLRNLAAELGEPDE
ncbi:MAG: RNA polymerase sigma factor [Chloroflexota bacterium]